MAEQLADRDGAVASYRKILAVDPEDPQALRLLGKLLGAAERWDELAEVLGREVAVAERQPNLVAEAAELRYRLGPIRHQRLSDPTARWSCTARCWRRSPAPGGAGRAGGPGPWHRSGRGRGGAHPGTALRRAWRAPKVVETLEARAANETDPARRAALLRRVAET